jgi:hypothetical protein
MVLLCRFFAKRNAVWVHGLQSWFCFNIFLLIFGCLGNLLWHSLTWQKLYVSVDRVVDFLPFIPFGQWVLDQNLGVERGRLLNDTSLWTLRFIWASIAAPVWTLAFWCTAVATRILTSASLRLRSHRAGS